MNEKYKIITREDVLTFCMDDCQLVEKFRTENKKNKLDLKWIFFQILNLLLFLLLCIII